MSQISKMSALAEGDARMGLALGTEELITCLAVCDCKLGWLLVNSSDFSLSIKIDRKVQWKGKTLQL